MGDDHPHPHSSWQSKEIPRRPEHPKHPRDSRGVTRNHWNASRHFWTPPPTNLLPYHPPRTPPSQVLSLRNQTLMNRTGKKSDAVPADLITKVLAGHTDPGGAGGSQDIDIQVVPLLGVHRVNNRHRSQASTSVLLATDSGGQGKSKTAISVSPWWIVASS